MILFQITRVHYIHVAEKQIIKIIQALAQKKRFIQKLSSIEFHPNELNNYDLVWQRYLHPFFSLFYLKLTKMMRYT